MNKNNPMKLAVEQARKTMNENIGGPFGAAIVDEKGEIIAVSSNRVLKDHDPTAHAEITTIREACKKLGTHDLSGYTMYATGFPCPMCLGAMIWANIKKCYYGATPKDAEEIGFRDDFIYRFIKDENLENKQVLDFENVDREACVNLFKEYHEKEKELY